MAYPNTPPRTKAEKERHRRSLRAQLAHVLAVHEKKKRARWQHEETGRTCETDGESPGPRWYRIPPARGTGE